MPHTPGPWTAKLARVVPEAPVFGFGITAEGKEPWLASAGVSPNGHVLILAAEYRKHITTGFTEEEVEANARLIAAAPELFAALKALVEASECSTDDADIWIAAIAAIAKAEGVA